MPCDHATAPGLESCLLATFLQAFENAIPSDHEDKCAHPVLEVLLAALCDGGGGGTAERGCDGSMGFQINKNTNPQP